MTEILIGRRLDEYRLEKLLGKGGMAQVYLGLDLGLHRYAAVKVVDTPYQQDEDYIARFEKEARTIAQLDHPHIVTIYRYGRTDSLLYLAMRYIEGADLQIILEDYEQKGQFMPLTDVARLVREIGSALDYAHQRGVIHRDVKPSNVMLNPEGHAYLTDFGLALLMDVGTRGKILGSPHYISPEQAVSSARAIPQSDIYSLGVILFRMVTGELPFDHVDLLELLMLHMTADPPDPRAIRPDLSPALAQVILKALAKEPDARFANGRELSDALEAAIKDKSTPFAAPTQSIIDRVAQDMEPLPQNAAPNPQNPPLRQSAPSPNEPAPAPKKRRPSRLARLLKLLAAALFFLLLTLTAVYLLRFPEDARLLIDIITTALTKLTQGSPS